MEATAQVGHKNVCGSIPPVATVNIYIGHKRMSETNNTRQAVRIAIESLLSFGFGIFSSMSKRPL